MKRILFLFCLSSFYSAAFAINGGHRVPWTKNFYRQRVVQVIDGNGFCSGTVVGENWVLTAAHCVRRPPVKVSFDKFDISEDPTVEIARRVISHPDYPKNRDADLALIFIENRIPLGYVPATLSRRNLNVGENIDVAGFGDRNTGKLYHVELALINPFEKSQIRWHQTARDGICDGDSGGSIFVPDTFELLGVIQRSPADCDHHGSGGAVPYFYNWIVDSMNEY